jgi:predicted kinase
MAFTLVVTGPIGAGKTTLARRLALERGALLLSSDEVRTSLSRRQRRSGTNVFARLAQQFDRALAENQPVILDSTGMSPRFRALLHAHRERVVHVHLTLDDVLRFEEREHGRRDRRGAPLPRGAFLRSRNVEFVELPDVVVSTDSRTIDEVYCIVRSAFK